jgi:hypothetical protein
MRARSRMWAKLTIARKIAAIALSMWKSKEKDDPGVASQAKLIARLTCGNVDPEERWDRFRSTWRRARFEGEYPCSSWLRSSRPEVPRIGYAPSEYRKKPWPEEVQIEGWFPLFAREQQGFDLVEDESENNSTRERLSSAWASGSDAHRGRVTDRKAPKARRACQLNTGKPRRSSQQDPDKPRRTCRLGADASVEEDGRRSGGCLDTTFHRRTSRPDHARQNRAGHQRGLAIGNARGAVTELAR